MTLALCLLVGAVAILAATVWALARAVVALGAQLAVLTLVVHDVRDQVGALAARDGPPIDNLTA